MKPGLSDDLQGPRGKGENLPEHHLVLSHGPPEIVALDSEHSVRWFLPHAPFYLALPVQGDKDTLAERSRRRPAKPMGSPRVGSNPTGVDVAGQWRARSVIACHQQSILLGGLCQTLCPSGRERAAEIHGALPAGVRSCHALLPGPVPIPLGHAASLQTLCWGSTSLRSQACRSMRQDHSA